MLCQLTYNFDGLKNQLVAVLSGEIDFPQFVIAYVALAYLETQQGLHMELTIYQKSDKGKVNIHHKCCIALYCPIANIEQLTPISQQQSPLQGFYAEVVAPENYQLYTLTQQALANAVTVIKADSYLWEYVQTGKIQKLEQQNLSLAYYHSPQNPWPFEYVILGLQICSLSIDELKKYIPNDNFPAITFDVDWPITAQNAFSFILSGLRLYIGAGKIWNEWIGENELVDVSIEIEFAKLYDLVTQIPLYKNINEQTWNDLSRLWIPCQQWANHLLTRLGWPLEARQPIKTAIELLDEYSYGYYSEMMQLGSVG